MRIKLIHFYRGGVLALGLLLGACSGDSGSKNGSDSSPDEKTCSSLGCSGMNKQCQMSDSNEPVCGECVDGYALVGDTCLAEGARCETLDCESSNRQCRQMSERALCSTCLPGFHEKAGECVRDKAADCDASYVVERCALQN